MDAERRAQLVRDGFCVIGDVLSSRMLQRLRATTDRLIENQSTEQAGRQRTTGSMISVMSDPLFAELVTWRPALDALASLGYPSPSFSDGWVIAKPGGGPRLFWHYDWFAWEDPASYRPEPLQVSLMYYLADTEPANGCLRVVPGSHNQQNALHDLLDAPRHELSAAPDTDRAEFDDRPDEVDVPVGAGDVVVADARLLHAAHENRTNERRTLITLWYQPDLSSLPERIQAQMAAKAQVPGDDWPTKARELLATVRTAYDGDAEPYGRTLYRRPPPDAGG